MKIQYRRARSQQASDLTDDEEIRHLLEVIVQMVEAVEAAIVAPQDSNKAIVT